MSNGYDWCYFTVEATPYFVTSLSLNDSVEITLSDGTSEPLDGATLRLDDDDVLRLKVKQGAFEARFGRLAQLQIAPLLSEDEPMAVVIAGRRYPIEGGVRV